MGKRSAVVELFLGDMGSIQRGRPPPVTRWAGSDPRPLYVANCLVNKHSLLSSEENGEPLTSLWPLSLSGRLGPVFQAPLFRLDGILGRA